MAVYVNNLDQMSALEGRSQDALLYALALAIETTPIGARE